MSGKKRGYAYDVDAWVQFHLLRLASFHPDTTKADLAVLAEIIQRYWGKFGNGWVTHEALGLMTGTSKATVIRAKRNLEQLGFITVVQAGRRGSATVYKPNFALVPEKGIKDDTETNGITDDTETNAIGIAGDTSTGQFGITDDTPSYLQDRPTRAGSQIDREEPAPPTAPLSDGLTATGAGGAGGFEELWKAYGHPQRKADAREAYEKAAPDSDLHGKMVEAAHAWHSAWAAQGKADAPRFSLAKWIEREEYDCHPPTAFPQKERKPKPAKAAKAEPQPDNDNERGAPVLDVGPFSPIGTFDVTIVGAKLIPDNNGEKVIIQLKLSDGYGAMHDMEHVLYGQHSDSKIQARGQAFLRTLAECLGIECLTDTGQLEGRRVSCTVDQRFAISYRKAA